MPKIVPITEGQGDVEAVPLLLRKILQHNKWWEWEVAHPKRAGSLSALKRKLDRFLGYAQREEDCGGILILLDLDECCPWDEARDLAQQIRQLNPSCPVAVVLAHREYEAWFLASLSTIAGHYGLPSGLTFPGDVEQERGVKEWLTAQMPPGKAYKETVHQVEFTTRIDLKLAHRNSRSFRRLCHAVGELVQLAGASHRGQVTPYEERAYETHRTEC